jgi:hypothetical protein
VFNFAHTSSSRSTRGNNKLHDSAVDFLAANFYDSLAPLLPSLISHEQHRRLISRRYLCGGSAR